MLLWATFDQNSVIVRVKLRDSTVATGAGKTGLSSSSSGLIISTIADSESAATAYTQAGSTIETITTLGTYAAPTATKCRFKEVDATNHPGIYELQFADARFSIASAKSLLISISGVTGLAQCDAVISLPLVDLFASGGTLDVNTTKIGGTTQTARDLGASVLLSSGTGTGQLDFTSGVVKSNVTQFGGSAGTSSGGRPEVNTTHVGGTSQTARDLSSDVILDSINDVSPAVGSFKGTSALNSSDDFYNGAVLVFTSGTLKGISRKISDYTGSTRLFSFTGATGAADAPFPTAPSNGNTFEILGRIG